MVNMSALCYFDLNVNIVRRFSLYLSSPRNIRGFHSDNNPSVYLLHLHHPTYVTFDNC
jgi:hypothetical protein